MTIDPRHSIARSDETVYDQGKINPKASFGDLLAYCFEHGGTRNETIAESIRQHASDDLAVIAAIADDEPQETRRIVERARIWLNLCEELAQRMAAAEDEQEQHLADDWEMFRVPTANGVPQFDHARRATVEDHRAVGFIDRDRAMDAMHSLIASEDKNAPQNIARRKAPEQSPAQKPATLPPPAALS